MTCDALRPQAARPLQPEEAVVVDLLSVLHIKRPAVVSARSRSDETRFRDCAGLDNILFSEALTAEGALVFAKIETGKTAWLRMTGQAKRPCKIKVWRL